MSTDPDARASELEKENRGDEDMNNTSSSASPQKPSGEPAPEAESDASPAAADGVISSSADAKQDGGAESQQAERSDSASPSQVISKKRTAEEMESSNDDDAKSPPAASGDAANAEENTGKKQTATSDPSPEKSPNNKDGKGEAKRDAKSPATPAVAVDPKRPVKKAKTAYFIFADEKRAEVQKQHPGEGVAVVGRALGQLWATISPEEKQRYTDLATADRERVARELQAWKDAGGVAPLPGDTGEKSGHHLVFPMARIRKICKLDPDVKGLSKEALLLVCKAAELACSKLGKECVRVAQIQNRRKLLPDDVAQVCATREQFLFLREDIQDLARQSNKEAASTAAKSTSKVAKANLKAGGKPAGKPLTDFFALKPKSN